MYSIYIYIYILQIRFHYVKINTITTTIMCKGYYADPEADCQAFHVCTSDGLGSLAKYTFLCPNGTIFNQEYFICDWWFNFDCSEAEGLYSLNEDIAAEREAATAAQSGNQGSASSPQGSYASPAGGAQPAYEAGRSGRNQRGNGRK